jgi:group I intron endonuclease
MKKVYIYLLSDPRNKSIKYVGKTYRVERRFRDHLNESKNTKKTAWVKKLKKNGLLPELFIIEETDELSCDFWEKYWISQIKTWGFELTNMTNGGDGSFSVVPWNKGKKGIFKHSEESKIKMSKTRKTSCLGDKNGFYGKNHSKESKEKMSAKRVGLKWSEKTKEKNSGINSKNCKKVFCYNLENNLIKIYNFGRQVIEDGFDWNCVSKVCRGVNKSHKNHIFSYYKLGA